MSVDEYWRKVAINAARSSSGVVVFPANWRLVGTTVPVPVPVAVVGLAVVEVGAIAGWLVSSAGVMAAPGLAAVSSMLEVLPVLVGLLSSSDKPWLASKVGPLGFREELSQIAGLPPDAFEFIGLGVEAGWTERGVRAVVGSSLNSGSCGLIIGDCREAVACCSSESVAPDWGRSLEALKLNPIGPEGISDEASSPLYSLPSSFTLLGCNVVCWELACASEADLRAGSASEGTSSFGPSSFGTSIAAKAPTDSDGFSVSASSFSFGLLPPCQARMLAVARAIRSTIKTIPLDQCSHHVRAGAASPVASPDVFSVEVAAPGAIDPVTAAMPATAAEVTAANCAVGRPVAVPEKVTANSCVGTFGINGNRNRTGVLATKLAARALAEGRALACARDCNFEDAVPGIAIRPYVGFGAYRRFTLDRRVTLVRLS